MEIAMYILVGALVGGPYVTIGFLCMMAGPGQKSLTRFLFWPYYFYVEVIKESK